MNIIVDVDGTIANHAHRMRFIDGTMHGERDWAQFYDPDMVAADTPIQSAVRALRLLYECGNRIVFLTGRHESLRSVTLNWFRKHLTIPVHPDDLFMREDGNRQPAVSFKERVVRVLHRHMMGDFLFIDDDVRSRDMYRKYGVYLLAPSCWDSLLAATE